MRTPCGRAGGPMPPLSDAARAALRVSSHPLVRAKVSALRDVHTEPARFRALTRELSWLLLYEALAGAPLRPSTVRTPLAETRGEELAETIGLAPILRAGL